MAFLGCHYRSPLEFSSDLLEETEQQVDRLRNVFRALGDVVAASVAPTSGSADAKLLAEIAQRRAAFDEALADDLNTAAALAEVFALAREVNVAVADRALSAAGSAGVAMELGAMCHVLGLDAVTVVEEAIPADIVAMGVERQQARAAKDFARADALRAALNERGYEVRDAPGGFKIVAVR
jgi:cysteinyl-tRNA synthetase